MITPKNLIKHELIGLKVKVTDSKNKYQVGIEGKVIDETKNTLIIETKKGLKRLPKDQCVFSFYLPSGERVRVNGKVLVARPEDRVKKKQKTW